DRMELHGVRAQLARRKGVAAQLLIDTPLGPVTVPAAVSVRLHVPWLPASFRGPMAFEFLDRGLAPEFPRAPQRILDPREIAAETSPRSRGARTSGTFARTSPMCGSC